MTLVINFKTKSNCEISYPSISKVKKFNSKKRKQIIFTGKLNSLKGFDIFGERNNIYDGTKGYHTNDVPHFNESKWVFLFNYLLDLYPDINIRRVIDEGPELEEIQNITYEELCQYLQINQKTLITSHQ